MNQKLSPRARRRHEKGKQTRKNKPNMKISSTFKRLSRNY